MFTTGLLSARRHIRSPTVSISTHVLSFPHPTTPNISFFFSLMFSLGLFVEELVPLIFFAPPLIFKFQTDVLASLKSNLTPPWSRAVHCCVLRKLQMQYELWPSLSLLSAGRCITQYYCMVAACQCGFISVLHKPIRNRGKRLPSILNNVNISHILEFK